MQVHIKPQMKLKLMRASGKAAADVFHMLDDVVIEGPVNLALTDDKVDALFAHTLNARSAKY